MVRSARSLPAYPFGSVGANPPPPAQVSLMANVVNLNRFRKQKARELASETAAENRIRFGRTKAQKAQDEAMACADRDKLDGLRRAPAEPSDGKVDPVPERER